MTDAIEEFFVASRTPGQGHAAIVADKDKSVKRFFSQHAGCSIVRVGRDEMEKMLRAYIDARRAKKPCPHGISDWRLCSDCNSD